MTIDTSVLERLLQEYTTYDKTTGKVFWKKSPSARAPVGKEVGSLVDGYYYSQITYEGKRYRFPLHKVVWFWEKGYYPKSIIDHKDMDRGNNRIENLRLATRTQNNVNRFYNKGVSKYQGVVYHTKNKKWIAQIGYDNKGLYIGSFENEEDAARAYDKKAVELFGEFAYTNLERYEEDY